MNNINNHKRAIAKHFSRHTEYWKIVYEDNQEEVRSFLTMEMRIRKESIINFLDTYAKGSCLSVLDVGCGAGGILKSILKRGYKAFGLDISMEMIIESKELAKKYVVGGTTCLQGDIETLPYLDNSFDVVLCVGVLQYLESDNIAIRELSRVIKPSGIILVTVPNILRINNILDPYYYLHRATNYFWYKILMRFKRSLKSTRKKDFSKNTDFSNRRYFYWKLGKKFGLCGLEIVDTYAIGFGPMTLWRRQFLPLSLSKKIYNFYIKLLKKRNINFIKAFANRWVFCLKERK